MTIKSALTKAAQKLESFDSAQLDADILLAFVLNKSKEFLYTHPEVKLNWIQKIRFFYLISRRSKNWPIAYLTGQKEFYGRNFYVNKNVLIPRPLTEELIAKALANIKPGDTICDLGTGSGCIIITIIKELQKQNYDLSDFKFYAVDISPKALQVAKKNAYFHGVDQYIEFLQGDLLKPLQGLKIDLILANLPYLDTNDLNEPSIKKEPKLALVGTYDKFFQQVAQLNPQPIVIYEDKTGINIKTSSV
ncbi:MAG: HemK/PrmC family methyltransferase [Candidatus Komeilibacteria bacterium]|nr:HemK/PrmC family methyltransferase [Candidatus Komeilibacteria bacterium]